MANLAIVSGHLGQNPELRHTKTGKPVCSFTVATSDKWTDDAGERREQTEWHRIVVWGPQAEACAKYLGKGSSVYVEGKMTTRSFDDKDGAKRSVTEITAAKVEFTGSGARSEGRSGEYHIDHPGNEGRAPRQPTPAAAPQTPFDEPKPPEDSFPF